MGFFQDLATQTETRGLPFLVIGGLAVNFHGISRDTADLDLLIQREEKARWTDLLSEMGYSVERDAGVFIQFAPPQANAWPVDLMLVAESSFGQMLQAGKPVEMFGAPVKIASLEHLIALKLHALKHTRAHRFLKDFQDVEGLIRANHLDPKSENIRQLFEKYGTLRLHEQIVRACSNK
jgi:predicted nucleotidyltransferase